jgi:hypothetical protein
MEEQANSGLGAAKVMHPDSFSAKLDYNMLAWRQIDRIEFLLAFSLNTTDTFGNNTYQIRSVPVLFAIKSSIQGLEALLSPRLVSISTYWAAKKELLCNTKNLESSAMGGRGFDSSQQNYVNLLLQWFSLLMQQLPKLKMMRAAGGELESEPNE